MHPDATTPTLPAAVRDTIYEAVTDLKLERWFGDKQSEEMREMLIGSLTAALGPVWAEAQKDSERLDWLTNSIGWCIAHGPRRDADPSEHATEDNTLSDAWRAAIDAARKKEDK